MNKQQVCKMAFEFVIKRGYNTLAPISYGIVNNLMADFAIEFAEAEKIKVSSHQTDLQSADSGQLQQHVVMESVCACPIPLEKTFSDKCGICDRKLKRYAQTAP